MEASAAFHTDRDREVAGQAEGARPQLPPTAQRRGPIDDRAPASSRALGRETPGRGPARSRHRCRPSTTTKPCRARAGSDALAELGLPPGSTYAISKVSSSAQPGAKAARAFRRLAGFGPRPHRMSAPTGPPQRCCGRSHQARPGMAISRGREIPAPGWATLPRAAGPAARK